jgi:hypothetical protein
MGITNQIQMRTALVKVASNSMAAMDIGEPVQMSNLQDQVESQMGVRPGTDFSIETLESYTDFTVYMIEGIWLVIKL